MFNYSWLVLILLHSVLPQTTDKYSDEDRPYKFGFNIQGYQHRQEEKDERGLIKGEYGFITADGYYRVTVYATDENGDFRILSMKNYYVGFPPEDPTTTPGPSGGSSVAKRPPFGGQQGPTGRALGGFRQTSTTPKAFTRPQGIAACSDCSIPTTSPRTAQDQRIDTGDFRTGRQEGIFGGGSGGGGLSPSFPQTSPRGQFQQGRTQTSGQTPSFPASRISNIQTTSLNPNIPAVGSQKQGDNLRAGISGTGALGGGSPVSGGFGNSGFPRGRTDFTANNELGDTPSRRPHIGEVRDGLPPGVTLNDIKDLLYTFNYTVGFHGHHEDGYRNGEKQGDYFFGGRDGVERKVEYLANEFGYQPNITLIDLPENDVRRPNEQTEKEYGLKGYEFKWFYRK